MFPSKKRLPKMSCFTVNKLVSSVGSGAASRRSSPSPGASPAHNNVNKPSPSPKRRLQVEIVQQQAEANGEEEEEYLVVSSCSGRPTPTPQCPGSSPMRRRTVTPSHRPGFYHEVSSNLAN